MNQLAKVLALRQRWCELHEDYYVPDVCWTCEQINTGQTPDW